MNVNAARFGVRFDKGQPEIDEINAIPYDDIGRGQIAMNNPVLVQDAHELAYSLAYRFRNHFSCERSFYPLHY